MIEGNRSIRHLDVSVSAFDAYQPAEPNTLDLIHDAADYLPTIEQRLADLERAAPHFDLCLYNAGMDPFERCAIGGLTGITQETLQARERLIFDWCHRRGISIAFVLAGGYTGPDLERAGLVDLHRLTLKETQRTIKDRLPGAGSSSRQQAK